MPAIPLPTPIHALTAKDMYLARVVVDDFCVGNDTMKVPPPLPGTSNLWPYDSTVDQLNQPSMHVVYHDAQA